MFNDNEQFDEQFNFELNRFENMIEEGDAYYFDTETLEQIIDFYIIKNQFAKALTAIKFGLDQHPNHFAFNLKKAQIYSSNGQLKDSLLLLQNLEKLDAYNTEVYITIANVFSQLRDHKNAIKYYEKALTIAETSEEIDELIEILLDLALEYENAQDFNMAIIVLKKLLKVSPNNESAIYEIAYCYERIGDFDSCIRYYNKYIDNNPYSFTAWYNLGNIYFLKKELDKAIWAYDYSTIINEEFSSAYFNMGNTYMQMEEFNKAIDAYKKCLTIDQEDALTLCYIGEAYERLEDYNIALIYYEKSKSINPDIADTWIGIGIVKDLLGKTNESISYFQHATGLQPDNANYLLVLGEALFKLDRHAEAELILEKALQIDRDYDEAITMLAKIKKEYNINEAIYFLIEADKNQELSISNQILLCSLLWENGQRLEALEVFKNQFVKNAKKSVKYLLLYLPESTQYSEFNNIINSQDEI
ncbi:MAG TPA: tetratricopeptide repeat protein [Crocinitomix sp.]|nr:tetratricopeptide repeat protein [Crocinitomix sp.]